ncbi:MAG TPA: methyltransferase domain-containing protein [Thermomicrobiales bacterium]|jgi:ubiquinone/menaquinone biosynthesis C-methylase UbiE
MQPSTADVKRRVRDQFSSSAADYVRSVTHSSGADLARMVELADPEVDDVLLDVATGGGHVARIFGPLVGRVVLADLTRPMLIEAMRFLYSSGLGGVDGVAADAEHLPFSGATFNLVTCRIAPHHFPRPDRFVLETSRVLKPDGRFILIDSTVPDGTLGDFFNRFEKLRDPSHVRSLTIEEWSGLIAESGLSLRAIESFRKRHDFDDWTARSRTTPEARATLVEMMRSLGNEAGSEFEVEWDDGRLVSFSDVKTLFVAVNERA